MNDECEMNPPAALRAAMRAGDEGQASAGVVMCPACRHPKWAEDAVCQTCESRVRRARPDLLQRWKDRHQTPALEAAITTDLILCAVQCKPVVGRKPRNAGGVQP